MSSQPHKNVPNKGHKPGFKSFLRKKAHQNNSRHLQNSRKRLFTESQEMESKKENAPPVHPRNGPAFAFPNNPSQEGSSEPKDPQPVLSGIHLPFNPPGQPNGTQKQAPTRAELTLSFHALPRAGSDPAVFYNFLMEDRVGKRSIMFFLLHLGNWFLPVRFAVWLLVQFSSVHVFIFSFFLFSFFRYRGPQSPNTRIRSSEIISKN